MASNSFLQQTLLPLVFGAALPLGCASSSVISESQDASYCATEDLSGNAWRVLLRDDQTVMESNTGRGLSPSERNPSPAEVSRIAGAQTQSYQVCYGPGAGASRPVYLTQAPDRLDHPCTGDTSFRSLPVDLRRGEALSLIRFAHLTDQQYCVSPTSGGVRLSLHAEAPQFQSMIEGLRRETHEQTPLFRGDRADDLIHSLNTFVNPQATNSPTITTAAGAGNNSGNLYSLFLLTSIVLAAFYVPFRLAQGYLLAAPLGLTRDWDPMVARVLKLLNKAHARFLIDMKAKADAGQLKAAIGRNDDYENFAERLYTESGKIPVVVADTGEGKSRFLEGLIHQIYHDRFGNHYTSTDYRQKDRLFPDFDPQTTMAYRLSLKDLHANNSVLFNILWHEFMQRIEGHLKQGHRVILAIDEISRIYGTGANAETGPLVGLIHDWIDNQLDGNRNLRVVGATTVEQYRKFIYDFETYQETSYGDPSLGRRLPHWPLPTMSHDGLRSVVDASCEGWEQRHKIHITKEARIRLLELSRHASIRTKNPSAVQDLLEDVLARAIRKTAKGELVTAIDVDFVHDVFAQRHHLKAQDVRDWVPQTPTQEEKPAVLPPLRRPTSSPPPRRGAKLNGTSSATTAGQA